MSGAKFGIKATLPHLLGVVIGTGMLATLSSFGVNSIILRLPAFEALLKVISAGWITFLAVQLLYKENIEIAGRNSRPFKFFEAILFQLINPKLWALTLSASAGFNLDYPILIEASIFFVLFALINLAVCSLWLAFGKYVSHYLKKKIIWRCFVTVMAIFLLGSAYFILIK